MFKVYDTGKLATAHNYPVDKSWDKAEFDTFVEAKAYAMNWLGGVYQHLIKDLNQPFCITYCGLSDIEIIEVDTDLFENNLEDEPCCSCGTFEDVTWAPDPYAHEINGDNTDVPLCSKCRLEFALDV